MTHQILSSMAAPCLHCGQQAHPTHLIGERDFYCAEHCPCCQPAEPLAGGEAKPAGEQGGLFGP